MKIDTGSRSFLVLLVLLSMLGPLSLNIIMPSLPGLPTALGTSREKAQLTYSLYLFGMAIGQLLLGPFADWFGRRPVVISALALFIVASFAAALAPNVEVLIVARVAQSLGATAGLTLGRTMIRDIFDSGRAASLIGYVTMVMVVAPMVSPLIGAQIDEHFGWRMILAFLTFAGLLSFALAYMRLPETRPDTLVAPSAGEVARRSLGLLKHRRFMAYWATSGFCSALFFGMIGTLPHLIIEVLGYSKTQYSLMNMTLALGYMVGNFVSARNAERLGIDVLVRWGNFAGLIGALVLFVPVLFGVLHPVALFVPALIMSFGNGLVLPNAISGAIGTDPAAAGAASGLMGFGQVGVGAVVSYLSINITHDTAMPLALLMLGCALVALAAGWVSRQPEHIPLR